MLARFGSVSAFAFGTLVGLAGFAAVTVACSAPADAKKKPGAVACDVTDTKCQDNPSEAPTDNQTHSDVPTGPVAVPDPPASTADAAPAPTKAKEAGVDAAPVVGQLCQQLSKCCDDLAAAGYDTTMCKSVLSTNNEDACYTKHDSYVQSGDCT